jgi:hypothetical protein
MPQRASIIRGIRASPAKILADSPLNGQPAQRTACSKSLQEQPMKTIAQFIKDRTTSLPDLQDALQVAMQLEFSTIPPYLCAQWSINTDPGGVGDMIENIVVQEMDHFALAGNMLTAIGGMPSIANAAFIPNYPTNVLPGGIPQKLAVDLKPLTPDQVQVFMQIEYPEFPPVALAVGPATIGAFYDTIYNGFSTVNPAINPNAFAVNLDEATPIKSVADALKAISLIKSEGEGTQGSPDQPPQNNTTLAPLLRVQGDPCSENTGAGRGRQLEFHGCCNPVSDMVRFSAIDRNPKPVTCLQSSRIESSDRPAGVLDERCPAERSRHE